MGVGGLISVLLSISAYLLHFLVLDIREMKVGLAEVRTDCRWLKADNASLRRLVSKQQTSRGRQGGHPLLAGSASKAGIRRR